MLRKKINWTKACALKSKKHQKPKNVLSVSLEPSSCTAGRSNEKPVGKNVSVVEGKSVKKGILRNTSRKLPPAVLLKKGGKKKIPSEEKP